MKKEYSKRKFSIAIILSAILLLLISATTVHADVNPLAKMPRKDSTVINKGIWWTGATFITPYQIQRLQQLREMVKSMYILPVADAMLGMK